LIALCSGIRDNVPSAIHRTALTPDGQKLGRRTLGPKTGCAIKLSVDADVTIGLAIGEGLETVLAGMALGFCPAWSVCDAASVGNFPLLSGIEALTIFVDRDKNGTGYRRALECSNRWTSFGREVRRVIPARVGDDMADVVVARSARR
jgi:hypothetical protein